MAASFVLLFYVALGIAVVVLGAVLFARSVRSRRRYWCRQCGERMTVELMEARNCNQCGAPLDRE